MSRDINKAQLSQNVITTTGTKSLFLMLQGQEAQGPSSAKLHKMALSGTEDEAAKADTSSGESSGRYGVSAAQRPAFTWRRRAACRQGSLWHV